MVVEKNRILEEFEENERIYEGGHCYVVIDTVRYAFREDDAFDPDGWIDIYAIAENDDSDMNEPLGSLNVFSGEKR